MGLVQSWSPVYVLIFLTFAPKKEKGRILGLLIFILGMFSAIAFISVFALHGQKRKLLCGYAGCSHSIFHYNVSISSLSHGDGVSSTVIKTRVWSSCHSFCPCSFSGTSWFIFGLLEKDNFVAVPNGFGSGLGAIQLILYAIYCKNKGEKKENHCRWIPREGTRQQWQSLPREYIEQASTARRTRRD
ncbi:hypothetical protein RJ639_023932, partial [Escallonia herrerae]